MTKEEFEIRYIKKSDITEEFYHSKFVTLSCVCDADNCEGWAAVSNNESSIKIHKDLYENR